MRRIRVFLLTAVPLAALAILFMFSAAPVGAQGFVIFPQFVGELGSNGWYVSDVSIGWNVPASATNVVGCEDVYIDYDTAGEFIECHYEYVGQFYGGSGIIRRDTTPPQPGCNIQPGATYPLTEGESLALDCSASTDNLSTVLASFDTNEDGVYGDAPVFYAINELVGPCFIGVRLADEAGNVTEFTSYVTVANAPPTVKIVGVDNQNTAIGGDVTVYVDVEDPGVNDVLAAYVNWGDNTSLSGWVVPTMISGLPAHTYNFPGTYTVAVTIIDDAGGVSNMDTAQITVQDPLGTIDIIENDVITAVGLGEYNRGQENSLRAKLDASRASITREVFDAAAGELRAFAYQGFAITDPDSQVTPCFDLALQLADALDGLVAPPD
ncbi:MAG: PKD domain-containing protein [Candidatus Promineifilaceae bacterium]